MFFFSDDSTADVDQNSLQGPLYNTVIESTASMYNLVEDVQQDHPVHYSFEPADGVQNSFVPIHQPMYIPNNNNNFNLQKYLDNDPPQNYETYGTENPQHFATIEGKTAFEKNLKDCQFLIYNSVRKLQFRS